MRLVVVQGDGVGTVNGARPPIVTVKMPSYVSYLINSYRNE